VDANSLSVATLALSIWIEGLTSKVEANALFTTTLQSSASPNLCRVVDRLSLSSLDRRQLRADIYARNHLIYPCS